jgi:L-histidine N-alpha-methyltransferase
MPIATSVVNEYAAQFAADVRSGLDKRGQKELPSKYFYDHVGSPLFEVICQLPEYGLTRAEERLLRRHANEIVARLPAPLIVSELGSGSGKKTRYLLQTLTKEEPVTYYPIEISPTALALCERELSDINHINVVGTEGEYLNGLFEVAVQRPANYYLLVLFLGSTIGNFDRDADLRFLQRVREILNIGDALLLGADLLKPTKQLLSAYDDPLGVTAAFNLNLLARINRELDGDFQLECFEHQARFNRETSSIEMHLSSRKSQTVTIAGAELKLATSTRLQSYIR